MVIFLLLKYLPVVSVDALTR